MINIKNRQLANNFRREQATKIRHIFHRNTVCVLMQCYSFLNFSIHDSYKIVHLSQTFSPHSQPQIFLDSCHIQYSTVPKNMRFSGYNVKVGRIKFHNVNTFTLWNLVLLFHIISWKCSCRLGQCTLKKCSNLLSSLFWGLKTFNFIPKEEEGLVGVGCWPWTMPCWFGIYRPGMPCLGSQLLSNYTVPSPPPSPLHHSPPHLPPPTSSAAKVGWLGSESTMHPITI
jgi:hypothetical protein